MYQPDEHYYVIRRESKFVYYVTLFICLYLNWFGFALAYAFFACNLLFDDEDEDFIEATDPEDEYIEDIYGVVFDNDLVPRIVTYDTLNDFLDLVTDLPQLTNWSNLSVIIKDKFKNYLRENSVFPSLYPDYHDLNIKEEKPNLLIDKYSDLLESSPELNKQKNKYLSKQKFKDSVILLNSFASDNKDPHILYLPTEGLPPEHDILVAHLFKGSRDVTTYSQIATREKEYGKHSFMFKSKILKKMYLKKIFAFESKTDLAYNDYILKSYIIQGFILIMIMSFLILCKT